MAIVTLEVQLHAARKPGAPDQGLHHADHLGALFVDGDGVEVVYLYITVGPHRVRHRAGVFRELGSAQNPHVLYPLNGACRGFHAQVLRKLLIAEHGQAFFQAELEPVAACHAVAGPIVKILVANH